MPRVFLSYARADGELPAADLRERLKREAPDIEIKQDRLFLEGGVGWWKQLAEAIDSVEFLILVMTPAAYASGNVQKEWRYARQQGVCIYPVKGAPDSELQFAQMPRWMSKAHFFDLEKEWPIRHGAGVGAEGVPALFGLSTHRAQDDPPCCSGCTAVEAAARSYSALNSQPIRAITAIRYIHTSRAMPAPTEPYITL